MILALLDLRQMSLLANDFVYCEDFTFVMMMVTWVGKVIFIATTLALFFFLFLFLLLFF